MSADFKTYNLVSKIFTVPVGTGLVFDNWASHTPVTDESVQAIITQIGVNQPSLIESDTILSDQGTRNLAVWGDGTRTIWTHGIHKHSIAPYPEFNALIFNGNLKLLAGKPYYAHAWGGNVGSVNGLVQFIMQLVVS